MPSQRAVPVTMGCASAHTASHGPFLITAASFPAGAALPPHTHDRVTFAVMLDGGFDLVIGGRRLACEPGTVFTEPGGERHSNEVGTGGANVVVVQPHPTVELPPACAALLDGVNHFHHPTIPRLAARLRMELDAPDSVSPLAIQALAFEMLAAGAQLRCADSGRRPAPAWFGRIEELIHDRFRDPLRVEDLAREAGVHPAHFTRVFRRRYHMSPAAYVRRLRLEWAAARLVETDDPVSRIALRAGFADQSHFTRAFHRHAGLPPARFRRRRRG